MSERLSAMKNGVLVRIKCWKERFISEGLSAGKKGM